MKKAAALCLILTLVANFLSCCGSKNSSDNTGTNDASANTDAEVTAAEDTAVDTIDYEKAWDELPKKDYDGADFTFFIDAETLERPLEYWYTESLSGDVLNDAVYERNRKVEEKYNLNFKCECPADYYKVADYVIKSIMAGDSEYDLVIPHYEVFPIIRTT